MENVLIWIKLKTNRTAAVIAVGNWLLVGGCVLGTGKSRSGQESTSFSRNSAQEISKNEFEF